MAKLLKDRKLASSSAISRIDLSSYTTISEFNLFLTDLYKCLYGQSDLVLFEDIDKCHSSIIDAITSLTITGKYTLNSRYIFQNNNLVEATGMLVQNSISEISANEKFFVFSSESRSKKFIMC